jgi:hypothetical protein
LQGDVVGPAASEKFDDALIDQRHILQIQNDISRPHLFGQLLLDFNEIVGFYSTAESEYNLPVPALSNPEHASSCKRPTEIHRNPGLLHQLRLAKRSISVSGFNHAT